MAIVVINSSSELPSNVSGSFKLESSIPKLLSFDEDLVISVRLSKEEKWALNDDF